MSCYLFEMLLLLPIFSLSSLLGCLILLCLLSLSLEVLGSLNLSRAKKQSALTFLSSKLFKQRFATLTPLLLIIESLFYTIVLCFKKNILSCYVVKGV